MEKHQSMSTTVITALYDIGRDKLTGKVAQRSFSKYLSWFKYLLKINVPMVIFIPSYLEQYVRENRSLDYKTTIIIREFEQLSAYKYYDIIQSIIDNMAKEVGKPKHFSLCPEYMTAKYQTIIYSKFDFLYEVSNSNPYNSQYFIWLDAGTFYNDPPFDYNLPWPDPYKINILGNKFLISNTNLTDLTPIKDKKHVLRQNNNVICAFILGGNKNIIEQVHKQFWQEVNNTIQLGVASNEQNILHLMILEQPDRYFLWKPKIIHLYNKNFNKDRAIPYELAIGTYISVGYPINPKIKLYSVATKNIPESRYKRLQLTAKYYGYHYEFLGRNKEWQGFNSKIKLYNEALAHTKEPYTILVDCNDLFICASSDELCNKFEALKKDLIVGGERIPHYPSNGNKNDIFKYFENIKHSDQAYPNSGFIMGKTDKLKQLMELHMGYKDDQVACFDTIYHNKMNLSIDYNITLIGNVPNYRQIKSEEDYEFNNKLRRYKNIQSGEYPAVLHFPGGSVYMMDKFFMNQNEELLLSDTFHTGTGFIFLILFIIIIFLFAILFPTY